MSENCCRPFCEIHLHKITIKQYEDNFPKLAVILEQIAEQKHTS